MNIKLKIIKIQLELLRSMLHFLLNLRKPTDMLVIYCSQQLDESIVKYHKVKYHKVKSTLDKPTSINNKALFNNTLNPF